MNWKLPWLMRLQRTWICGIGMICDDNVKLWRSFYMMIIINIIWQWNYNMMIIFAIRKSLFFHQMENGWTQNPRAPCVFVSYLPLSQYSVFCSTIPNVSQRKDLGSTRKPNNNSLPTSFRWCLDLAPEVRHHPWPPHQHLAPDQQSQIFVIKKRDRMQTRLFSYVWWMVIFLSKKKSKDTLMPCLPKEKSCAPVSGFEPSLCNKSVGVRASGWMSWCPRFLNTQYSSLSLCSVKMGSQHLNPSCPVCRVESDWKRRNLQTS